MKVLLQITVVLKVIDDGPKVIKGPQGEPNQRLLSSVEYVTADDQPTVRSASANCLDRVQKFIESQAAMNDELTTGPRLIGG